MSFWEKFLGKRSGTATIDPLEKRGGSEVIGGEDDIPEGNELQERIGAFVDEVERQPISKKGFGPNILVADKSTGEYLGIDEYRDREKNVTSQGITEARQKIKEAMAKREKTSPADSKAAAVAKIDRQIAEPDEKLADPDLGYSNQKLAERIAIKTREVGKEVNDEEVDDIRERIKEGDDSPEMIEKRKIQEEQGSVVKINLAQAESDRSKADEQKKLEEMRHLDSEKVSHGLPKKFKDKIKEISEGIHKENEEEVLVPEKNIETKPLTIDEKLSELDRLVSSEDILDHHQAAEILRGLSEEEEKYLVKNIKPETAKRLQEIEVPEFGRRPKRVPEISDEEKLKKRAEQAKADKDDLKKRKYSSEDKSDYLQFQQKTIDPRRQWRDDLQEKPEQKDVQNSEEETVFEVNVPADEKVSVAESSKIVDEEEVVFESKISADEKNIDNEAIKENSQETIVSPIEKSFADNFGITAEDLKGIDGFQELSDGQKSFVLENLRQISLGRVKEGSEIEFEEKTKQIAREKKGLGKIGSLAMNNLLKNFKMASIERRKAIEVTAGGIKDHGEVLRSLVDGMKDGPEVIEKDGQLELQFASLEKWHNEGEKEIAESFNSAASRFMTIPKEWGYENATSEQKKKYEEAKQEYESARSEYLDLEVVWHGEKWACQDINSIDEKIQLNQLLNHNPAAEEELLALSTKSELSKGIMNSLKSSRGRGVSMSVGFAARSLAVSTLGAAGSLVAAPIVGGVIGAWRGKVRAEKAIENQDKKARRGEGVVDKKANAFVSAVHLIKRLNDLSAQYNELKMADGAAKAGAVMASLKTRIDFIQEKLDNGLVDFGTAVDYSEKTRQEQASEFSGEEKHEGVIGNQFSLIQSLAQAKALVVAENFKVEDGSLNERLERFLEFNKNKIGDERKKYVRNEIKKGALTCAGFALAGAAFRDVAGDWFGWNKGHGSVIKSGVSKAREFIRSGSNVEASPSTPDDFSQTIVNLSGDKVPEVGKVFVDEKGVSIGENKYFGGKTVWGEAEKQIAAWRGVEGKMPLKDIDKVKDLIVAHPENYGLQAGDNVDDLTSAQLRSVDWDRALADAHLNKDFDVVENNYVIKNNDLKLTEKFKEQIAGNKEQESINNLENTLKNVGFKGVVPMNKAVEVLPTEEVTTVVGSPDHLKAFIDDPDSKKTLEEMSKKALTYFNGQNKWADRTAAANELGLMKKTIEEEFGGTVGFDEHGTVKINMPDGSSKILFSPEAQAKVDVSDIKIENSGNGDARVEVAAAIKGGQIDLNQEMLNKLSPADRRAVEITAKNLRVLANNLKRLPENSSQAAGLRKTMGAIMNSAEDKFGKGVFGKDLTMVVRGADMPAGGGTAMMGVAKRGMLDMDQANRVAASRPMSVAELDETTKDIPDKFDKLKVSVDDQQENPIFDLKEIKVANKAGVTPSAEAVSVSNDETSVVAENSGLQTEKILDNDKTLNLDSFKGVKNNPLGEFPQKELVFSSDKISGVEKAELDNYFKETLAERNETVKQLADWKAKYGDRPQYKIFEKEVEKEVSRMNGQLESVAKYAAGKYDGEMKVSVSGNMDPAKAADMSLERLASRTKLWTVKESSEEAWGELHKELETLGGKKVGQTVGGTAERASAQANGQIIEQQDVVENKPTIEKTPAIEKNTPPQIKEQVVNKGDALPPRPEGSHPVASKSVVEKVEVNAPKAVENVPASEMPATMTLQEAKTFDQPFTDPKLITSLAEQGSYINLRNVPEVSKEVLKAISDQKNGKVFNLIGLDANRLDDESCHLLAAMKGKGKVVVFDDVLKKIEKISKAGKAAEVAGNI